MILRIIGKRRLYSILLGALYVLLSYGTSNLFFPAHVSISMIFFITLLLIPSCHKIMSIKEKTGFGNVFFKRNAILMEVFLFLFIGIFIGYAIIGTYDNGALSYQNEFLNSKGITGNFIQNNIEKSSHLTEIISNNVSVIMISFVLSIFYGIGALFLTVLNASIFAGFVLKLSGLVGGQSALATIHMVPEVFAFLLASIAGGIISKAIAKEHIGSESFRSMARDSAFFLISSILMILMAGLIEVFVTPVLF